MVLSSCGSALTKGRIYVRWFAVPSPRAPFLILSHDFPLQTDPSQRYVVTGGDRKGLLCLRTLQLLSTLLVSTMAATEPPNFWDQNYLDAAVYKSNVSQSEYLLKHRLFFEEIRRGELKRLRLNGESIKNVPRQRIYTFQALDDTNLSQTSQELVKHFRYNVHIPSRRNSITKIEHAELHIEIIPTSCTKTDQQVSLLVDQERQQVHVDACRPRWESLTVNLLPFSLNVSCSDCGAKGVTFSRPFLNIVTTTTRRTRYPRRVRSRDRRRCRLTQLVIDFKELPSFKSVASPRTVNIGRCRGSCVPDFRPHSQHAFFRYDLAKIGKGPLPCCAPSQYKDLEYLMPNRTRLQKYHWPDAIATKCTCH